MPQKYVRNRDNIVASYTDCLVYSSDDVQQLSPSAAHHETNIKNALDCHLTTKGDTIAVPPCVIQPKPNISYCTGLYQ